MSICNITIRSGARSGQKCGRKHCGIPQHVMQRTWLHNMKIQDDAKQKEFHGIVVVENEEPRFDKDDTTQQKNFLYTYFCADVASIIVPYTLELSVEQKKAKKLEDYINSFTD